MPTTPAGTTFDMSNTKLAAGEKIDSGVWGKFIESIMFNWLGTTNSPKISWGVASALLQDGSGFTTNPVVFSTGKTDGVDGFSTISTFVVFLTPASIASDDYDESDLFYYATNTSNLGFSIITKQQAGVSSQSISMNWLAIGY